MNKNNLILHIGILNFEKKRLLKMKKTFIYTLFLTFFNLSFGYANQESINKNGFLSSDLKKIYKIDTLIEPKNKIILIHNHGQNTFDGSQSQCSSYDQLRNKASLVDKIVNGKKIMVYNLCTNKFKGDMPLKWWISKDKPYIGKTKLDYRVEANLKLVEELVSMGVPRKQIFISGHSCGGMTTLLFFARYPDKAAGGISYMHACFGKLSKQYKVKKLGKEAAMEKFAKKRPGPSKLRVKFENEMKTIKTPILAFTHPKDNYEGLLSDWMDDMSNINRIIISNDYKINGKKCLKHKKSSKETVKTGHQMDQGLCFQYYNPKIIEYISSRI